MLRTGVVLPIFSRSPDLAIAVAREAEERGVDGVFCYDHLWPMGQRERPALAPFPVLAAVATATRRIALGTLVARVGLVPNEVLVSQFVTLSELAPGRVIAGLGSGDRLSAAENLAYGIAYEPAAERRRAMGRCALVLEQLGLPVWIGGGAPRTLALAEELKVAVNLWAADPVEVAAQAARTEVTWAGPAPGVPGSVPGPAPAPGGAGGVEPTGVTVPPAPGTSDPVADLVDVLAAAGASWVVLGWPAPLGALASAGARHRAQ